MKMQRRGAVKRFKEFINQTFNENRVLQMNFECTSKDKHKIYVIFQLTDDNSLIKDWTISVNFRF